LLPDNLSRISGGCRPVECHLDEGAALADRPDFNNASQASGKRAGACERDGFRQAAGGTGLVRSRRGWRRTRGNSVKLMLTSMLTVAT